MSVALTKPDFCTAIELARRLVSDAIVELDNAGGPADIAAHLDMALHRMTETLALEQGRGMSGLD